MKNRAFGAGLLTLILIGGSLVAGWAGSAMAYEVGDRLPRDLRGDRYAFDGWRDMHLRRPPRGAHWAEIDGDYILIAANGTVIDIVDGDRDEGPRGPRAYGYNQPPPPPPGPPAFAPPPGPAPGWDRWRARYNRSYDLQDDRAYAECHNKVDPAGIFAGAILGGILGNVAGGRHDSGGATVAGVVAGGALGAALTSKMDCDDRSYAYKTYNDAFNAGRANYRYNWRNPANNDSGELYVMDYYRDEDNFRCAVFSNTVYMHGQREEARGRACQQPNGTWAIID